MACLKLCHVSCHSPSLLTPPVGPELGSAWMCVAEKGPKFLSHCLLAWDGVEEALKVSRALHKVSQQCLPWGLLCVYAGGTFQTLPASELLYKWSTHQCAWKSFSCLEKLPHHSGASGTSSHPTFSPCHQWYLLQGSDVLPQTLLFPTSLFPAPPTGSTPGT